MAEIGIGKHRLSVQLSNLKLYSAIKKQWNSGCVCIYIYIGRDPESNLNQ